MNEMKLNLPPALQSALDEFYAAPQPDPVCGISASPTVPAADRIDSTGCIKAGASFPALN